ncbi:MAG TPA: UDP-N-acetylmuramoyl-tripeptide--D-alanyl-D-alanine ligase [Geobacteraceae bacterium]|nr:UDP-N-acetylmuramoyl-tripeptide--D-alanyl-D-alanine ligase [Geobacteraceae bacterium]
MFTIEEIARATGGSIRGDATGTVSGVSTDSRLVKAGELFVPLRGERFDGHDFIVPAMGRGVRVFLAQSGWIRENALPSAATVVAVEDTLRALGDLAAFHRRRFRIPVVGITGSNGKTTVKEMLAAILALTGSGLKTSGNLNNLIGLPQMLLQLKDGDSWAVLEMGMSEPGEIDRLAEIAGPEVGVITNAFAAHLESMGSVAAVAAAKGELFQRLLPGGCAVYNADDPLISRLTTPDGVRRLSFGLYGGEISAGNLERKGRQGQKFTLTLNGEGYQVRLKALGLHNISNSLAAAAAACAMGVAAEDICRGLEQFTPYDKRFNLEELDGIVLIDDSYNANPASMRAAMETLRDIREECRAIAVLGDMLELGEITKEAHLELGSFAASCVERLYVMGEMAETVAEGARRGGLPQGAVILADSHEEIIADLRNSLASGDFILVKGSRGMGMEKVAEGIRREFPVTGLKGAVA